MWKCPNCLTDNQNNFCKTCGTPKPQQEQSQVVNNPNFSQSNSNHQIPHIDELNYPTPMSEYARNNANYPKHKKKNNNVLIAICIILAMILSGFIGIGAYVMVNNNDKSNKITLKPSEASSLSDNEHQNDNTKFEDMVAEDVVDLAEESAEETIIIEEDDVETVEIPDDEAVNFKDNYADDTSYKLYRNSQYSFECAYPASFVDKPSQGINALKTLESPDSTARMTIRASSNYDDLSLEEAIDGYKSAFSGEVTYEAHGDDWYAISIDSGDILNYRKFFMRDGNLYCMDFRFHEIYLDIYAPYIEYIEDHFYTL